jgi:hypothetical protein
MVGQVLGAVGHLPNIYTELEVSYYLLRRLLGVRTEGMSILYYLYPARGLLLPAQQASGRQDRGYVYLVLHFRKKSQRFLTFRLLDSQGKAGIVLYSIMIEVFLVYFASHFPS